MIGWFTIQYEVITLSTNTVELVIKIDVRICRSVQSCHCLIARKVVAVYICMTSLYVQQRKGTYRNKTNSAAHLRCTRSRENYTSTLIQGAIVRNNFRQIH